MTIHTKGFAISPYFSSTIDSITGRTVEKALVDLPPWEAYTKYSTAMKAYIALSRVRKADDILIQEIMSPTLFACGLHPWPTRLMQVLRGETQRPDDKECQTIEKQNNTPFKLKICLSIVQHAMLHTAESTSSRYHSPKAKTKNGTRKSWRKSFNQEIEGPVLKKRHPMPI